MSKRKAVQFDSSADAGIHSGDSPKKLNPHPPRKKVSVDDDGVDYDADLGDSGSEDGSEKPAKQDNDDDEENPDDLNVADIGAEQKTLDFDEDIKITPFNMEEELEEGEFDKDGTFVYKKDALIRDSWLEEYDWGNAKQLEATRKAQEQRETKVVSGDQNQDEFEKLTDISIRSHFLSILKPRETVAAALCRLGKATRTLSASERLKQKKLAAKQGQNQTAAAMIVEADTKQLNRLTELADILVRRGNMGVYEETFELITFRVNQEKSQCVKEATMDMFSEIAPPILAQSTMPPPPAAATSNKSISTDAVQWEYKMSAEPAAEIRGPVTTLQLMDFVKSADSKEPPVNYYCRRTGSSGQFYNANRVDFSLYVDDDT